MTMNEKITFAIYARKSSTTEDRQVLSIDSQIDEMQAVARNAGLYVKKIYKDSQTAHKLGKRESFSQLLEDIQEGKINGILTWKADRLSRNAIEGAYIMDALQNNRVQLIKTPHQEYRPTDNILPLTIEFGMANQYSNDLSRNVKRGNKKKITMGGYCGPAPQGYRNDLLNKTIIPDPERFELVRKMWDLMLLGTYSVPQICDIANNDWSYRTPRKKKLGGIALSKSSLYSIFSNKFYCGHVKAGNFVNIHGSHVPMVTETEFERVQEMLRRSGRKGETNNEFPFTGNIRCGECGCSVTAEIKVKYRCPSCNKTHTAKHASKCVCGYRFTGSDLLSGKWYTYYHCSKKRGPCGQACIRQEAIEKRFIDVLQGLEIDQDFELWAIKWIKALNESRYQKKKQENDIFQRRYASAEKKVYNLIQMRANDEISQDEFTAMKESAIEEREQAKLNLSIAEGHDDNWIERLSEDVNFVVGITNRFNAGTVKEKKRIFSKLGSNFVLKDGNLSLEVQMPYSTFSELQEIAPLTVEPTQSGSMTEYIEGLNLTSSTWLGEKESNLHSRLQRPLSYH